MSDFGWDRDFALEQAGEDEELLQELLNLFHDSSAGDLAKIKDGAAQKNSGAIGDAAHSIKGAAASLGINHIRSIAANMEGAGRTGNLELAKKLMPELETLLLQFKTVS